jgi:hypothetical protein
MKDWSNRTPTFYAVIPAHVRYANISAQAKLLYGELTALTEKEGFCWASNGYLAKLYGAGERSVSRRVHPWSSDEGYRRVNGLKEARRKT